MTDRKVTLKQIADAINLPVDYLSYLNPIYKKGVIPVSDQQMAIRLPSNKVNTYLANLSTIYKVEENTAVAEFVSNDKDDDLIFDQVKKYHRVKKGEHLLTIAKHYRCSVNDIKSWNRLRSTKLSTGQKLTIYTSGTKKAVKVAEKSSTKKATSTAVKTNNQSTGSSDNTGDSKFVWHTVQSGDSLWKIAQRYQGVTVEQIKELNNLQSNELKVGTKLKVVING
jgi:membrane-bound lytic murein transglycosylase D